MIEPLKSTQPLPERALFSAPNTTLEVTAQPSGAWRVRLSSRAELPAYDSLSVLAENQPLPLRQKQSANGSTLSAGSVTVKVKANSLGVSFADSVVKAFAADLSLTIAYDRITVRKVYDPADVVYGLGEKTGWLDKRHRRYKMRNTDVWLEHPAGIGYTTDPLYASFPFFIVHNPQHTYGIFVDNTGFTEFDFTAEDYYQFSAPHDLLTYYVLPGPSLPEVIAQYTTLTGRMPLPALWTLGYHQCRWGYQSEEDINRIAKELRQRHLPADSIWMDIDYMNEYRVFTWDKKDFPDPKAMITKLNKDGFRAVTIIDPGVKVDEGYAVYDSGRADHLFVNHANGDEYNGSVWPGRSAFPDFHTQAARDWWAKLVQAWCDDYGLSGVWNDMNEPAATDLSGPITDAYHEGGNLPHVEARNTYGLQMARAAYQGLLQHNPDSRPFILTRAAFSGAQTVSALWAGDNHAYWEHLSGSIPMLVNLGLSGMPFVGVDIGGFGSDSYGELLARWTQLGAFYPFCRNHAASNTINHEPWVFGSEVEAICRHYIELRYQLLPYFYNLFHEASQNGIPFLRPMAWHYPADKTGLKLSDQCLVGRDLLIAPITAPGQTARSVYLPKGTWYRWGSDDVATGPAHLVADAPLDELPLYIRAGAILPMWPLAQHTDAIDKTKTTLHIWPGNGDLNYYEDDGSTRAYERGPEGWRTTQITLKQSKAGLTLKIAKPQGQYQPGRKAWTVIVHGITKTANFGKWNKAKQTLTFSVPDDGKAQTITIK
jgi:alpha-glucosidase